jgi:hypothetical protein
MALTLTTANRAHRTASVLDYNSSYTVTQWVYLRATDDARTFFTIRNTDNDVFKHLDSALQVWTDARGARTTDYTTVSTSNVTVTTGVWYFCATVYSGNTVSFYMGTESSDAVLIGSTSQDVSSRPASQSIIIGGRDTGNYNAMDGAQEAVKVWTRALSDVEIVAEQYTRTAQSTTNLWAEWKLVDALTDTSGNSRDLSAIGSTAYESGPSITDGGGAASQDVDVPLLTNTSTLYAPTISAGVVSLVVPLLTNTSTLHNPTLSQNVTLPLLTNTQTFFNPTLAQNIVAPVVVNTSTLYTPTIIPDAVSLTVPLLENANALYAPSIVTGAVELGVPLLDSTSTLFAPVIVPDSVTVAVPLLTNSQTFYGATIEPDAVTLAIPLLSNDSTLFVPTLANDGVLAVPLLVNESTLFAPVIETEASTLLVPLLVNTSTLFNPELSQGIRVPLLQSDTTLFAPAIIPGASAIEVPLLTNQSSIYVPALSAVVSVPLLVNDSVFFAPQITVSAVTLTMPLLLNINTLFGFVISGGTVTPAPNRNVGSITLRTTDTAAITLGADDNNITVKVTDHANI